MSNALQCNFHRMPYFAFQAYTIQSKIPFYWKITFLSENYFHKGNYFWVAFPSIGTAKKADVIQYRRGENYPGLSNDHPRWWMVKSRESIQWVLRGCADKKMLKIITKICPFSVELIVPHSNSRMDKNHLDHFHFDHFDFD